MVRGIKTQNAIAATWLVSFNQIRRSNSDAADLLSFISTIENKAIPRSLLPAMEPEERLSYAIGTLRAYAFISERSGSNTYDMHRLVHLASKVWPKETHTTKKVNEGMAAHLVDIFP